MKAPIDTKKIAERVASIRKRVDDGDLWRFMASRAETRELCGYVERLLSERKMLLDMVAIGHSNFPFLRGHFECDCSLCTEHRELITVGDTNDAAK